MKGPCAGCGKTISIGKDSLPIGRATCHGCRAARGRYCRVWPRNCAHCKRPFVARHPGTLTCGPDCSRKRQSGNTARNTWKSGKRRSVEKWTDITARHEAEMRRHTRKCQLCGTWMTGKPKRSNSKELDHIIPICMGGTHTHGNVRIICRLCNLKRPKDGSDYTGPVTLWAQVPGAVSLQPRPKASPKPKAETRMESCTDCGNPFIKRSPRHPRCSACMERLASHAISLRGQGVAWKDIAAATGYTIGGIHLLAQRHGLYAA